MMTREQMEAVIARGGSVMLDVPGKQPRVVHRLEDLPTAASLAVASGDADAKQKARESARAKLEAAQAELREIEAAEASPPGPAKPEPAAPPTPPKPAEKK